MTWRNESRRHSLARKGIKTANGIKAKRKNEILKDFFNYSFKDVDFTYDNLTTKEKKILSKEEFEKLKKEYLQLKASGKSKFTMVRDLMRKEGIDPEYASPNFVKDFADNRGIHLTAEEVVEISNKYELKASGVSSDVAKVKKGDHVFFKGDEYIVTSESYISHPEQLIGGRRAKEGFYVQLYPVDPDVEEESGWINQARIKKKKGE